MSLEHADLCVLPEDFGAHVAELLAVLEDGEEVVAGEAAELAGEGAGAVGEENLGLAVAAGVEEDLARRGVARGVLPGHVEVEAAQRNPTGFAAPARVDELLAVRQYLCI